MIKKPGLSVLRLFLAAGALLWPQTEDPPRYMNKIRKGCSRFMYTERTKSSSSRESGSA